MKKNIIIAVLSVALILAISVLIFREINTNANIESQIHTQIEEFDSSMKSYAETKSEQDYFNATLSIDKVIMLIEMNFSDNRICKKEIDRLILLSSYLQTEKDFVNDNISQVLEISDKLLNDIDDMNAYIQIYELRSKLDDSLY